MILSREFFEPGRNVLPDPLLEGGALVHHVRQVLSGVTDTSAVVHVPVISGLWSLRVSCSANTNPAAQGELVVVAWRAPTGPGDAWAAAVEVGFVTAGFLGRLRVRFLTAAGAVVTEQINEDSGRSRLVLENLVTPLTSTQIEFALALRLDSAGAGATGQAVFDELVLTPTAEIIDAFDGDDSSCAWEGAAHRSPSIRRGESAELDVILDWMPPYWYSEPVEA